MTVQSDVSPKPSASTLGEDAGADKMGAAGPAVGQATGGTLGAFQITQQGRVYYGATPNEAREALRGPHGRPIPSETEMWLTPTEAWEDFYHWDDKQRRDLTAAGVISGQLKEGAGDIETAAWWKQLVTEAARYGAAGQKVTPMDLAAGYVSAAGQARRSRAGKRTVTQTNVDITDPNTAKALTTQLFQSLLGRDPAPGEVGSFAAALNAAERSSPSVTTTTSEYGEQGEVLSQSSTTTGGLTQAGQQQLLADKLKQQSEYGVQQAATTYADATRKKIWGGPGA